MDVNQATNVLDCWVSAAARSLTIFVAQEMAAYKVYTVVPMLVKFIESLTNIYVRYNRRRLKGAKGVDDTLMALGTLFDVLLKVCKVGLCRCGELQSAAALQGVRQHRCPLSESAATQGAKVLLKTCSQHCRRAVDGQQAGTLQLWQAEWWGLAAPHVPKAGQQRLLLIKGLRSNVCTKWYPVSQWGANTGLRP